MKNVVKHIDTGEGEPAANLRASNTAVSSVGVYSSHRAAKFRTVHQGPLRKQPYLTTAVFKSYTRDL